MKQKVLTYSALFAGATGFALLILQLAGFSPKDDITDLQYLQYMNEHYKVFSPVVPESIDFCGEAVPLELTDVKERLDREILVNTYWHSNTFLLVKRANRWFPVIEPILEKNGIPEDFKYLALIESGLTNAVSPSGATGFWQFLDKTGLQYGLEINDEIDERYHVVKSTEAACRYLNDAYKKFGSWPLVAASYNMGMGGVEKQLNRQKENRYWDLLLNEETGRYVYRILAVKAIVQDPGNYGFHMRQQDLYLPYETREIQVDSAITDLSLWAQQNGTNYKSLKILNPWLRQPSLTNKNARQYSILLPQKGSL